MQLLTQSQRGLLDGKPGQQLGVLACQAPQHVHDAATHTLHLENSRCWGQLTDTSVEPRSDLASSPTCTASSWKHAALSFCCHRHYIATHMLAMSCGSCPGTCSFTHNNI